MKADRTERAQRDLLGALSALDAVEGGTAGLFFGIDVNVPVAMAAGQPEIAAVYMALRKVAEAGLAGDSRLASAQRRLLEALSSVARTGRTGMGRLLVGLEAAAEQIRAAGEAELADAFEALGRLARAVEDRRPARMKRLRT